MEALKTVSAKGSSLTELLLALPVMIALITGSLFICYYIFAQQWLQHHLHEAILCSDSADSTYFCRRSMAKNISKTLPIGSIKRIDLRLRKQFIVGLVEFQLVGDFPISEIQKLQRPILFEHLTRSSPLE